MDTTPPYDAIPLENVYETHGPDEAGMMTHLFYAFNTVITLQAFGDMATCTAAFDSARRACRQFERRLSRTLPNSDISRLNAAAGEHVPIDDDTAALLRTALRYCAESDGCFDITVGSVVRLWNFHEGIIPDQASIDAALPHVNWRGVRVETERGHSFAWIDDPHAAVDVGGIAKGWIADRIATLLEQAHISSFIVNLGGNVVAHGEKPTGAPWRIGLQDPRDKTALVGAVEVQNTSAVTSGVYERCFKRDGAFYHHILNPTTGYPAKTDVAGVTVLARQSIDAEGYSTTLLALGIERGCTFARNHPAILQAYFVTGDGVVYEA